MKKIIVRIQVLVFAILSLTACSDFLEKDVTGESDANDYYDTKYKLQSALNAVYDVLQSDEFTENECPQTSKLAKFKLPM